MDLQADPFNVHTRVWLPEPCIPDEGKALDAKLRAQYLKFTSDMSVQEIARSCRKCDPRKPINHSIVEARKLEHPCPHALKGKVQGIRALILLKPCSNFLGFTLNPLIQA